MTGEYGDIQDLFDAAGEPESMPAAMPGSVPGALALLNQWVELEWIRALDHAFAEFVCTTVTEHQEIPTPELALLAALASHQVGRGHVCLDLGQLCDSADDTLALPPEEVSGAFSEPQDGTLASGPHPDALFRDSHVDALKRALSNSCAVGGADDTTPLVLDGQRLYLRRFWRYEQTVASGIQTRLSEATGVNAAHLSEALNALFGTTTALDYQKIACAIAANNRFSVITGGPGTGKTTTVVKLLAALQSVAFQTANPADADPCLRIRLSAPTGKAAARLSESIGGAVGRLPLATLPGTPPASAIPSQVTTLHRLLGSRPGSRQFRHNRDNPLPLDILVIDEASMVDVDLMASVFDALPDDARLIMLGDKDQLASVDAGAVLGELCQRADQGHYLPETAKWLESVTGAELPDKLLDSQGQPMDQAVGMLRKSYRFDAGSGIGVLASAINDSRFDRALLSQCKNQSFADVAWLGRDSLYRQSPDGVRDANALAPLAEHARTGSAERFPNGGQGRQVDGKPTAPPVGYEYYLNTMTQQRPDSSNSERATWDAWATEVLNAFGQFQVLCALRKGPFGVEGLNQQIAGVLHSAGLIDRTEGWYAGRPVLVTGNDYNLGLMNGDIGVTLSVPWDQNDKGEPVDTLRVAFLTNNPADGVQSVRWISPSRLQSLETVYAMTVHKSQGSEFTHASLVIPDRLTPVLTRELIYTGITRARHWLSLAVANEGVFREACQRGVIRASGLAGLLDGSG